MYELNRQYKSIYIIAGIISLLLSYWLSIRESVINPDAICYLQSAADMKSGLQLGMHVCGQAKWPFYSILIYFLSSITHISFENSAYLIDASCSLISVVTFIAIVGLITKNMRIIGIAAVVILFSHEFNSVRQYIVRDHGFWAFYLLSIYFLLCHFRDQKWKDAIAWSVSLTIATLFRVEGAIFLLIIPVFSFFQFRLNFLSRLKSFFQLNTLAILACLGLLTAVITMHSHVNVSRLYDVWFQVAHGIPAVIQHFTTIKLALGQYVLGADSAHDAGIVLTLMLCSWYVVSVAVNVSLIYMALIAYAWFRRLMHAENYVHLVLWAYIITGVIVTSAFLTEHMFLSKRYLIALSLVLMLWVPFALNDLVQKYQTRKWPITILALLILLSSLGGIIDFGYSKKYIHEAGDWLSINVPKDAQIYTNDFQVMYYSRHFGDSIFSKSESFNDLKMLSDGKWKQYDYIAVRINKNDSNDNLKIVKEIQYAQVQAFSNKRGDQVRIYRRDKL